MSKYNVLYISSEINPFLPDTEISRVSRKLPQGIQEKGNEIRTFMPRFGKINERRNQLHEVIRLSGMNMVIDDSDHPLIIKVASIPTARMQVYFIDNEEYFQRKTIFEEEEGKLHEDNDVRAIFFARGVLETVKKLRWQPDIIHCHGWFSSLVPLYLKKSYSDDPIFSTAKVITSVYDNSFDASLGDTLTKKIDFSGITPEDLEIISDPTYTNLTKLAVNMSDAVVYGSQNIDEELVSHIESRKIPTVPFTDEEDIVETYDEFYKTLLND